jgi:hypothetical protein
MTRGQSHCDIASASAAKVSYEVDPEEQQTHIVNQIKVLKKRRLTMKTRGIPITAGRGWRSIAVCQSPTPHPHP